VQRNECHKHAVPPTQPSLARTSSRTPPVQHRSAADCCPPACAKSGGRTAAPNLCGKSYQLITCFYGSMSHLPVTPATDNYFVRTFHGRKYDYPSSVFPVNWSTALRNASSVRAGRFSSHTFTPCISTASAARSTPCPEASLSFSATGPPFRAVRTRSRYPDLSLTSSRSRARAAKDPVTIPHSSPHARAPHHR